MLPIKNYFQKPQLIGSGLLRNYGAWIPDALYLRLLYRCEMGKRLNLKQPKTFNEKLQWLKLYNRKPEYTKMVDKAAVKEYVASTIGPEYVIPTLGLWEKPEDIEWECLPDKFVLKTTHGGGSTGVVICRDKGTFDRNEAINRLNYSLKSDGYIRRREWPYKNVHRRIIAEQYIEPVPPKIDLPDYKFFCFNGKVQSLFVATERQMAGEDVKFDFFDKDYNHLPFKQGHENAKITPSKPKNFELMKQIAERLSDGIPQVRVDLYDLGDRVLFGEMTFFHFSGMVPFEPQEWDCKFGEWVDLSI